MQNVADFDLHHRAAEGKRSPLTQQLFNWMSNDETTYRTVQSIVTERYLEESRAIFAAGGALKVWVENEVDSFKDAARQDWRRMPRMFRDNRDTVYGMVCYLLDHALGEMTEADWQILAADLLEEPYTSEIHKLAQ